MPFVSPFVSRSTMYRLAATSAVVLAASGIALAQMAPEEAVQTRQNIMKSVGAATGVGGGMAKGEIAFDAKVAGSVLATYVAASHTFDDYFPEGSENVGDTEAKPEIWSDRAGFEAKLAEFRESAEAGAAAKPDSLEAFQPVFGAITQSCKSCHQNYRVQKQ